MLSDSDTEDVTQLTINEHYAKAYAHRKEREELQKLKDKYGSDAELDTEEEEDSEELESEDEDGDELTPAVDAAILRTLARIKRRDPSIYDADKGVFEEERMTLGNAQPSRRRTKENESKSLTLRQQALESALNPEGSRSVSPQPLTHVEEQRALRKETISAFHGAVDDAESEDDLLVPREKTKDEVEREEEEYREFLEREVGEDLHDLITLDDGDEGAPYATEGPEPETRDEKKRRKKEKRVKEKEAQTRKEKSQEDKDRDFLMNYIFNRGWIDRSAGRVPTYKEITKGSKSKTEDDTEELDDERHQTGEDDSAPLLDEEFEDVVDHFESSYNFRFEEPDAAEIKRYPRSIQSTVRREDTTRKEAREKRKARKQEELANKREEVNRLKALKTKELQSKLERIGREGGLGYEDEALQALDLDGDWDPSAHDRQMGDIYGGADAEGHDEEKPTWDDDIDITDIVPEAEPSKKTKKKKSKKKKATEADEDGVDLDAMDADVHRDEDDEVWDGTEEMRKRVLDKYMDEISSLEFNDMVGDLPTRFKYASVAADAFGLSGAEILRANDAELNSYVGLKQFAPYREGKKRWDNKRNERLAEFRNALAARGAAIEPSYTDKRRRDGGEDGERPIKKRKGKKERLREKATAQMEEETYEELE